MKNQKQITEFILCQLKIAIEQTKCGLARKEEQFSLLCQYYLLLDLGVCFWSESLGNHAVATSRYHRNFW